MLHVERHPIHPICVVLEPVWRRREAQRRRASDAMDDEIRHVESALSGVSTAEVLWGGPRGDGLVHTVTRLSETVERLAETVGTLGGRVTGSEGVEAKLAAMATTIDAIKTDVRDVKEDVAEKYAAVVGAGRWVLVAFWSLLVPGILWVIGHAIYAAVAR